MRKDSRVHWGMVMSGPLVFRLPIVSRASCLLLERNETNSLTHFTWSSNVRGRSSCLAFLSSWNTFAHWAILLCRGISPFADVNILTALLPVSHTKTVFRNTHKAVGLFHWFWTPSVSPHTFVRVSLHSKHLFFLQAEQCVLFAGGQEHGSTICHCNSHEKFEIVLSFSRLLTWQRWIHESFPSPTNRYWSTHVKANEVNKLDGSKQNNSFNCPTQSVSSSSTTPEI